MFHSSFYAKILHVYFIIVIGSISALFYLIMAFILSGKIDKLDRE